MQLNINNALLDVDDPRIAYTVDRATQDAACVVATMEGATHREALANSPQGRARLAQYPQRAQDLLIPGIWGDTPTVEDPVPPAPPDPPPEPQPDPTTRIAELEQQVADLTAAIERGISL
jgi:hypothetical protein